MAMIESDLTKQLQQIIADAAQQSKALEIQGGGSKSFYGRKIDARPLPVGEHRGITHYRPKELVVTARCGTNLKELESVLAEQGQMLAFEPLHFSVDSTLGGTIACGLSGPRRAYAGSVRDFVLGATILNGRAEVLKFGGEVMKNVAGYDVSRLIVGSMGTLGIILDVSLKVLPLPVEEVTLLQEHAPEQIIYKMNKLSTTNNPISATFYDGLNLYIRLSGTLSGVTASAKKIGGERLASNDIWQQLRGMKHAFFRPVKPLWRLSVPSDSPYLSAYDQQCVEWGGGQRWLLTHADSESVRCAATDAGGHATLFKGGDRKSEVFHPLPDGIRVIHENLKQSFDPLRILNPGKMYQEL